MSNIDLITNSACPICKTGKMKFMRLVVNRIDYGKGKKFLEFKCNRCNYKMAKRYMVNYEQQLNFNYDGTS